MKIPKLFLGAFKCGHRKNQRMYIDDELSYHLLNICLENSFLNDQNERIFNDCDALTQLKYITKFNNEYHKNVIATDGTALHNNTPAQLLGKKGETISLKKACQDLHNARNRDIHSRNEFDLLPIPPTATKQTEE